MPGLVVGFSLAPLKPAQPPPHPGCQLAARGGGSAADLRRVIEVELSAEISLGKAAIAASTAEADRAIRNRFRQFAGPVVTRKRPRQCLNLGIVYGGGQARAKLAREVDKGQRVQKARLRAKRTRRLRYGYSRKVMGSSLQGPGHRRLMEQGLVNLVNIRPLQRVLFGPLGTNLSSK